MEKLILKSNRTFLLKIILFAFIPSLLMTVITFIGCFFADNLNDILYVFVISFTLFLILFIILFYIIFIKKITLIFTKEKITIVNRKGHQTLYINNITEMVYYRYKWWYIFTTIFAPLPKGGCMKIHIKDNSNIHYTLGFFNYKDSLKIMEFYPNLMTID